MKVNGLNIPNCVAIRACTAHTDVLINGVPITHINHAKFLRVYIDKNLSWDFHRETVEKKNKQGVCDSR